MEKHLKINVPNGYEIDKEKSTFENIFFKKLSKEDKQKQMSDFLFETLNGMSLKMTNEKEITYYNSKNEWLIQQDYKRDALYVSYSRIWSVFESRFELNYQEISNFINHWVETNLNWKGLTPNE